jgi:glycosyltransferase involved in cell wall biosynthesis
MKKIRILFELSSLGYGGTEKAIYTFLENLDQNKFDIYLFFSTDYKTFPYYRRKLKALFSNKARERFKEKYVTYFTRLSDFQNIIGKNKVLLGNPTHFFKTIKKISPDLIHFNRGISETHYTKNVSKIPSHIKVVETNIFGKDANEKYITRLDKIFFISNWLIRQSPWVPDDKVFLLYNPIKLPSSAIDLREKYNIPHDAIVLGRMSRPNLDDGQFIFEVLQHTVSENVYFISIGASKTFKKQMGEYKNAIFIEPVTDVDFISSFYNTIDILLHYRKEGETFGMNIAEAMIHGKTVVSHNSYLDNAQAELLLEDKNCISGIVLEEHDLENYTEAVKTLINDDNLRIELSINAKKRATKLFAEDKVTDSLEKAYLSLFTP